MTANSNSTSIKKRSLRKILLHKRDGISFDLLTISSRQIHENLKKMGIYQKAKSIGCYYPIGSEVRTQDIMQEILDKKKTLSLPKIVKGDLSFRKISDLKKNLEKGSFGIMEPKDYCSISERMDLILVPTIAITREGVRLGYGQGYYDRFLSSENSVTVSLTYTKQIAKAIPFSKGDIKIDWIVTEDRHFKTMPSS